MMYGYMLCFCFVAIDYFCSLKNRLTFSELGLTVEKKGEGILSYKPRTMLGLLQILLRTPYKLTS